MASSDEDDLEALRLAALATLKSKPKPVEEDTPSPIQSVEQVFERQLPQQNVHPDPFEDIPLVFQQQMFFDRGRGRGRFQRGRGGRGRGFPSMPQSNLIVIPTMPMEGEEEKKPVKQEERKPLLLRPQDKWSSGGSTVSVTSAPVKSKDTSKFRRYDDDTDSEDEEEDVHHSDNEEEKEVAESRLSDNDVSKFGENDISGEGDYVYHSDEEMETNNTSREEQIRDDPLLDEPQVEISNSGQAEKNGPNVKASDTCQTPEETEVRGTNANNSYSQGQDSENTLGQQKEKIVTSDDEAEISHPDVSKIESEDGKKEDSASEPAESPPKEREPVVWETDNNSNSYSKFSRFNRHRSESASEEEEDEEEEIVEKKSPDKQDSNSDIDSEEEDELLRSRSPSVEKGRSVSPVTKPVRSRSSSSSSSSSASASSASSQSSSSSASYHSSSSSSSSSSEVTSREASPVPKVSVNKSSTKLSQRSLSPHSLHSRESERKKSSSRKMSVSPKRKSPPKKNKGRSLSPHRRGGKTVTPPRENYSSRPHLEERSKSRESDYRPKRKRNENDEDNDSKYMKHKSGKKLETKAKENNAMSKDDLEKLEARRKKFESANITHSTKTISLKGIVPESKRTKHKQQRTSKMARSPSNSPVRKDSKMSKSERRKSGEKISEQKRRHSSSSKPKRKSLDEKSDKYDSDSSSKSVSSLSDIDSDSETDTWRNKKSGASERQAFDIERERKQRLAKEREQRYQEKAQDKSYRDSGKGSRYNRDKGFDQRGSGEPIRPSAKERIYFKQNKKFYEEEDDSDSEAQSSSKRGLVSIIRNQRKGDTGAQDINVTRHFNKDSSISKQAVQGSLKERLIISVENAEEAAGDESRLAKDRHHKHKKNKKRKKKDLSSDEEFSPKEQNSQVNITFDAGQKPKPSVYDRLGVKVKPKSSEVVAEEESWFTEHTLPSGGKRQKLGNSKKHSTVDKDIRVDPLSQKIHKIKMKNAEIMKRKQEVEEDKQRYG